MQRLFPYIVKQTKADQIKITLIVLASFPFYFVSLDLPKQIITNAIQGKTFPTLGSTVKVLKITLSLPDFISSRRYEIFGGVDLEQFAYLFFLSGLFLLLVLLNGFFKYVINIRKGALGERFVQALRLSLFTRLLTFTPEALKHLKPSEAATILKDEVEPIGAFVGDAFVQPMFLGGQAATALLFIVLQSPQLGLIAVGILVIQLAVIPRLRREQMRLGVERQKKQRAFAGKVGEVVECLSEIGTQGGAAFERRHIAARLDDLYHVRFRLFERKFAVKFLNNLLAQLTPFLFYTIGGFYALKGDIDIGQLVAVIGAYRDLPPPLKELIDWDQQRLDVETKFQLVSEQFPNMNTVATEAQEAEHARDTTLDYPDITTDQANIRSISGDQLLARNSVELSFGSHVAVLDLGGDGARSFGQALGSRLALSSGTLKLGAFPIAEIAPDRLGRLVGYVDAEPIIFDGSIYDNIVYALHRVDPKHEASAQGGIDYRAAGSDTAAAFDERLLSILKIVGLDETVLAFGLARRLDAAENEAFIHRVVGIRRKLRTRLAERGATGMVEAFDPQRYMANGSVGENIIFGVPEDTALAGSGLADHPLLPSLLDRHDLADPLERMGERIAAGMLEIFRDINQDNVLFEQFAFVPASQFPTFREVLNRRAIGQPHPGDRRLLIGLALLYIEPRHRMGLLDDGLRRRILDLRAMFRTESGGSNTRIDFYDPDAYCASASLRENLLFGLIAHGAPQGAEEASATLAQVVAEEGLLIQVYHLGLKQQTGYGGRLLYPGTKVAVVLARNLVKKPSILVLNEAFGAFGEAGSALILQRVRMDMIGRTLVVIGRRIDRHWPFDVTLTFDGSKMVSVERSASGSLEGAAEPDAAAADGPENLELQALRAVPIFAGLDLANLKLLAFTSERVVFAPGEALFAQGQVSDVAYTIVSGTADISIESGAGPMLVSSVGERQIVGEMGIITGEPRSATVTATSTLVALRIRKDVFTALLAEFPVMALSVTRLMVKRLQDNVSAVRRRESEDVPE